jgi:hypothetical protein
MKHNLKRQIILIALLGTAALLFSEGFYSIDSGLNFFTDHYPKDNYSRVQSAWNFGASGYYYLKDDFGLFGRSTIASGRAWSEANVRESMLARRNKIFDFRLIASPAYRFKLGKVVQLPLSLGPVFIFNDETSKENTYSTGGISGGIDAKTYSYQALSLGLNLDATFNYVLKSGFTIKQGLSLDYVFLRAEKGEMRMNYRATHNPGYIGTPYYALNFGFYFGLGHSF